MNVGGIVKMTKCLSCGEETGSTDVYCVDCERKKADEYYKVMRRE